MGTNTSHMTVLDMAAAIALLEGLDVAEVEKKLLALLPLVPLGTSQYIAAGPLYGAGGWNRYYLHRHCDGRLRLRLSKAHIPDNNKELVEQAQDLGLWVG